MSLITKMVYPLLGTVEKLSTVVSEKSNNIVGVGFCGSNCKQDAVGLEWQKLGYYLY
jgi:hypothetical protein